MVARCPGPDYSCSTTGSSTMIVDSPVPSRLTLLRLPAGASRARPWTERTLVLKGVDGFVGRPGAAVGLAESLHVLARPLPPAPRRGTPGFPSCGVPAGQFPQGCLSPGPHAFAGTICPRRRRSTESFPAAGLGSRSTVRRQRRIEDNRRRGLCTSGFLAPPVRLESLTYFRSRVIAACDGGR